MRRFVSRVGVAAAVVVLFGSQRTADAFCNEWHVLGVDVSCDGGGHQSATAALEFLNDEVFDDIEDELQAQDGMFYMDCNAIHFDSCRFQEGTAYIHGKYVELIGKLDPSDPDPFSATDDFGRLLHPVQDFYAHSNWISLLELHDGSPVDPSLLIDSSVGDWRQLEPLSWIRDDIIVGQLQLEECGPHNDGLFGECMCGLPPEEEDDGDGENPLPPGWSVEHSLDSDTPTVTIHGDIDQTYRALITGWNEGGACVDGRPDEVACDDFGCPRTQKLTHGEGSFYRPCGSDYPTNICLNKDEEGRPGWEIAHTLATVQTGHEWCRLLHLTSESPFGFDAASILMTLWAKPASSGNPFGAHPVGTPCQAPPEHFVGKPAGPVELEVTPIVGTVPDDDTFSTLVFALYTADFTMSEHRVAFTPVNDLEPITMCVRPGDTVLSTVWGWEEGSAVTHLGEIDGDDHIWRGVTTALTGPTFQPGAHSAASDDIAVRFVVKTQLTDPDGDGLSLCGEGYYETDPNDPDTDDDGLSDGDEVNVHHTDPLNPDTDADGLLDGTEVYAFGTDPLSADTDGDGFVDGLEIYSLGTDPLDPDTDHDQLDDLTEVNVIGTSPVDSDSDDDGIGDGSEWLSVGTDPLDPDTDDDSLLDGFERKNGFVSPLDADTDGDGLDDGSDVEHIIGLIEAMPDSVFTAPGRPAILDSLEQVEALAWSGQRATAVQKLQQLQARMNGCGVLPDSNDWINGCPEQLEVRPLVVMLITQLSS